MTALTISPQQYEEFRHYLQDSCGVVLGDSNQEFLASRLGHVMQEYDIGTFSALLLRLASEPRTTLHKQIVNAMTTNETCWFRDTYPFEILKHVILPELSRAGSHQLRIWSAASSSGQEAYSLSMSIQEFLADSPGALPDDIEIVATDLSSAMIGEGRAASYDRTAMERGLSAERKQRFFTMRNKRWEVRPEIRKRVTFHELDLTHPYTSLGKFDIVFCRNVLIYFSSAFKRDILDRIAHTLEPGGYLFLGDSESPSCYSSVYETARTPLGVVYRFKG